MSVIKIKKEDRQNMLEGCYKSFDDIPSFEQTLYPVTHSNIPEVEVNEYREVVKNINPCKVVVDFGVGNGYYGRFLKDCLYFVIETPQTIKEFATKNASFAMYAQSIKSIAKPISLFVSNGGLQYDKEPLTTLAYVKSLLPSHILLQRTWISRKTFSYATIQVNPPHKVPIWVFSSKDIIKTLLPEYKLVYQKPSLSMKSYCDVDLYSYLFRKVK